MLRANFLLAAFALILAWTLFRSGGVLAPDWYVSLLALGLVLMLGYIPFSDGGLSAPADAVLFVVALAMPAWAALQLVPVPEFVFSSTRLHLAESLTAIGMRDMPPTISIRRASTVVELAHILGYVAAFFIARDLMWKYPRGQWRVCSPLLILGILEAGLAMYQGALDEAAIVPSGTFPNRDHFSVFLELSLPFALCGSIEYWTRRERRPVLSLGLGLAACLFMAAVVQSLSRGGFLIVIACCGVIAWVQSRRRFSGLLRVGVLTLSVVVLLALGAAVAPVGLLNRLETDPSAVFGLDNRLGFWRESIRAGMAYPITGCGFGAFSSCIASFREVVPTRALDFAHNDVLHLWVEGGAIAVLIALAGWASLASRLREAAKARRDWLAPACGISLTAFLIHSMFDFPSHIPACALAFAWVAGMTAGLRFSPSVPVLVPRLTHDEILAHFRR